MDEHYALRALVFLDHLLVNSPLDSLDEAGKFLVLIGGFEG